MITDLKYAFRMLLKTPAFTMIAVATLALGIGANSAIFSVVDAVLLRPLPFKNPEQLVMLWGTSVQSGESNVVHSYPNYLDHRDQSETFAALAAYTRSATVLQGAESQLLRGVGAPAELFDVLGVSPMLGRAYTREEHKVGGPQVVVLTHSLWQRAFGGDPKIVGEQLNLSGRMHEVLGVMPPGFKFPVGDDGIDYLTPLEPLVGSDLNSRGGIFLRIVGRLKEGVSLRQAEAENKAIAARLAQQYPEANTNRSVRLVPLHDSVVGQVRPALMILLGAVSLVLLIACANVANLLLARAASRSREIGIRTALGASRGAIVWQLLAESFLLALLGGLGGLLLAWWGIDVLSAAAPRGVPRVSEIRIDTTVALFTFGIAVLSTVLCGLVPALQVSRPNVSEALQQGAKGSTGGMQSNRIRAALVVSQVAVSLLLLAGAGLLIKSFFNLRGVDPGFDPSRVMIFDMGLPSARYPDPDQQRGFFDQLLPKLAAIPGVEAVGGANPLPLSGNSNVSSFTIAGQPPRPAGENPNASHLIVTGDYFQALKIPLKSGRTFNTRDHKDAPLLAVVNESFARQLLPNVNPIGQRIVLDVDEGEPAASAEIVGVVGDTRNEELGMEPGPEMYMPFAQNPQRRVVFAVRTAAGNPAGFEAAVRRAILDIDKEAFVPKIFPMTEMVAAGLAQPRFNMMLLAVFAGVAMILAAIGIYGVIAYSVAQRTREIGIRMALGAQRGAMLKMVLQQSLALVAVGLVIGLLASLAGTRLLSSLLFGVGATDVSTYAIVVVVLGGSAFLASYIPARRAMRVDPMVALRYE